MKTVRVTLPEFYALEGNAETSPVSRSRDIFTIIFLLNILGCFLQLMSGTDWSALLACVGVYTVFSVATIPVSVTLLVRCVSDSTLNADLPVELIPMKVCTSHWVNLKSQSLSTFIVSEEDDSL